MPARLPGDTIFQHQLRDRFTLSHRAQTGRDGHGQPEYTTSETTIKGLMTRPDRKSKWLDKEGWGLDDFLLFVMPSTTLVEGDTIDDGAATWNVEGVDDSGGRGHHLQVWCRLKR